MVARHPARDRRFTQPFAVRWTGSLTPPESQRYTFHILADDGVRLWVNDRLLAARMVPVAPAAEIAGAIALEAGIPVKIMLWAF